MVCVVVCIVVFMGSGRTKNDTPCRDDHPVKLPSGVLNRSSRIIDAAVLFIYGDPDTGERVYGIKDLAKRVGCDVMTVSHSMREDKWEEFRLDLVAERMMERTGEGRLALVGGQMEVGELRMVMRERARLEGEIPELERQTRLAMARLGELEPGEKGYSALLGVLEKLEGMLARRTGKEAYDGERVEVGKGLVRLAVKRAEGESVGELPVRGKEMVVEL